MKTNKKKLLIFQVCFMIDISWRYSIEFNSELVGMIQNIEQSTCCPS